MAKFDPSKKFESVEQKKFDPSSDFESLDTSKTESAIRGAAQGLSLGFADEITGGVESLFTDKSYEDARDEARRAYEAANKSNPGSYLAGEIGGGLATMAIPGLNVAKGAKLAATVGKAAAEGAVAGAGYSDEEDTLEIMKDSASGAALGGGLAYGVPKALSGLKSAGRLIPGTKDSLDVVNKGVSKLAGLNPLNKASADEVYDLLSDTAGRRAARDADYTSEVIAAGKSLDGARSGIKNRVSDAYSRLEMSAMNASDEGVDSETGTKVLDAITDAGKVRANNEDLYSSISGNVLKRVEHIVQNGAPDEVSRQLTFAGMKTDDITDPVMRSAAMKWRLLESRRALDDALKAKDMEKLPKYDRALVLDLRNNLNLSLQKEFSGASDLTKADELYSSLKPAMDEVFKPVTLKSTGKIDPRKLISNLNDDKVRGKVFSEANEQLQGLLAKYESELGKIPEVEAAMKQLGKLQELARWNSKLDIADRAAGGPTGQGANAVMQILGAYGTGGMSLLALPITNPSAYARLVDELAAVGNKEIAQSISKATKAMMDKAPGVASRLYISRSEED